MFNKILHTLLAAVFFLSGCASNPKEPVPAASIQSVPEDAASQEMEIGKKIHEQILNSFYVYTDPQVVGYLNAVNTKLTKYAERRDLAYQVTLLYSDKIYATSAPGGFIYVTTAMLNFLQNEAELASVLGHEIGQLQYHDPTLSEARKALQQVSQAGAMVSSAFGSIGALAALGFMAMSAASSPRARAPARRLADADRLALEYLASAGLDPQAMLDVMGRFAVLEQNDLPFYYDYYQARPLTIERMQALQKSFEQLPLEGKNFDTGYKNYQEMSRGVREIYRR